MRIEAYVPSHRDSYDVLIISKAFDHRAQNLAQRFRASGRRIIYDICDNYFLDPASASAQAMARMLALADAVVVSTEALKNIVVAYTPATTPIHVIGDAIESDLGIKVNPLSRWWHAKQLRSLSQRLPPGGGRLVWFGNHAGSGGGGMDDLASRLTDIATACRSEAVSLTVISNSRAKYDRLIAPGPVASRYLDWHPSTFLDALRIHDIAVLPIRSTPFTSCKSSNRVAQSLACGLAVVADAIPSYLPFAHCAAIGEGWETALGAYLKNPTMRAAHVEAGRRVVAEQCSIEAIVGQWRALIDASHAR